MTDSLILELPVAIDSGAAKGREVLAEKAVEYLKSLAQDEASDPTLRFELAKAYLAVGLAQGHPAWPSRGNRGRALENYTRAASLFEIVLASDPKNKAARLYLSRTYSDIGLLLLSTSSIESLQAHQHALSVLPPYDSDDWDLQVEYIAAYELIGERFGHPYYANIGDTARGFEYISKAFAIVETMVQRSLPGHADYYSQMIGVASNGSALRLSYGYNMMAGMLWARGQIGNAIRGVRTGIATFISLVGEVPRNGTLRDELAVRYLRLARLLAEDGQIQEALSDLEKTRRLLEPMIQVDAENRIPRRDLAASYNLTGSLLASLGHTKGSLDSYTKAARLSEDLLQLNADAPDEPEIRQHIADSYEGIGNTLAMTSHQADAIKNCLKALSIREVLVKLDPNNARYRSFFAQNHVSIGDIYVKEGDATLAVAFYDKAIHILEPMSSRDPMNWLLLRARADVYMKMGDAERALASSFRAGDRNRGNHVLAARSWYKLGLVLWNEMKAKGTLDRPHARMPAELTRKIASASAAP